MLAVREKEVLINRTQMLEIASEYQLYISKSTIHRWANTPNFPRVVGKKSKFLLYKKIEFISFLKLTLRRMEEAY